MAALLQLGGEVIWSFGDERPIVITLLDVDASREEDELRALLAEPILQVGRCDHRARR